MYTAIKYHKPPRHQNASDHVFYGVFYGKKDKKVMNCLVRVGNLRTSDLCGGEFARAPFFPQPTNFIRDMNGIFLKGMRNQNALSPKPCKQQNNVGTLKCTHNSCNINAILLIKMIPIAIFTLNPLLSTNMSAYKNYPYPIQNSK